MGKVLKVIPSLNESRNTIFLSSKKPKPQAHKGLALLVVSRKEPQRRLNVVLFLSAVHLAQFHFFSRWLGLAWHVLLFLASFNDTKLLHSRAASALVSFGVRVSQSWEQKLLDFWKLRKPGNVKVLLEQKPLFFLPSFFLCDLQTRTWVVCLGLGRVWYSAEVWDCSEFILFIISILENVTGIFCTCSQKCPVFRLRALCNFRIVATVHWSLLFFVLYFLPCRKESLSVTLPPTDKGDRHAYKWSAMQQRMR